MQEIGVGRRWLVRRGCVVRSARSGRIAACFVRICRSWNAWQLRKVGYAGRCRIRVGYLGLRNPCGSPLGRLRSRIANAEGTGNESRQQQPATDDWRPEETSHRHVFLPPGHSRPAGIINPSSTLRKALDNDCPNVFRVIYGHGSSPVSKFETSRRGSQTATRRNAAPAAPACPPLSRPRSR
jgi:hypothetical protein